MFTIIQTPYRPSGVEVTKLVVFVQGTVMTINDVEFDFSFMEKESFMPQVGMGSNHFNSDVVCDSTGLITLSLRVPVSANPTEAELNPPKLENKKYGKVIDLTIDPTVAPRSTEVSPNAN